MTFSCIFLHSAGDGTQGSVHSRQAFYHGAASQSDILKRVYCILPFLCSQPLSDFKAIRYYMTWPWISEFLSPLALLLQPCWPLSILEHVKAPFLHEKLSSESSLSTVYEIALWFFLLQYFALICYDLLSGAFMCSSIEI